MSRQALLLTFLLATIVLPALSSVATTVEVGSETTPCPFTLDICSSVDKLYQQCAHGPAAHVMTDQTAEIKKRLKKSAEEKQSLNQQLTGSRAEVRRLQNELEKAQTEVCRAPNFKVGLQCFFLSSDKKSWTSAVRACKDRGGTLAEPTNPLQLIAKIKQITQDRVYLGGRYRARDGRWVGVSGRSFNTRGNWNRGEPNNHRGEQEDCIDIHRGQNGLNDVSCHHTLRYLCEM